MTNTIRETAYKSLERIANIEDPSARKAALRKELAENHNLAIFIQRCYHPNYNFNLPKGDLPDSIAKRSNHDDYGMFYRNMRRWELFRIPDEVPMNANYKKHVVEQQFIDLYEAVATEDADLLIAVKDKKLPWDSLNIDFVVEAVPELFPSSFRPSTNNDENTQTVETTTKSKKEICRDIVKANPDLSRKDMLALFEREGISKTTGSLYYQQIKSENK